jgi:hypothetical protein
METGSQLAWPVLAALLTMRRVRSVDSVGAALAAALGLVGGCGGVAVTAADGGADGSGAEAGVDAMADAVPDAPGSCTSPHPCGDPTPLVLGGQDTGYDTCMGGSLRRRAMYDCPSLVPRASGGACTAHSPGPDAGRYCRSDADCTAMPNGFCQDQSVLGGYGCVCAYGCLRDGDCSPGEICVCADPVGECERAGCTSGASCDGCDCIDSTDYPGCPGKSFACQTPADQCTSDLDCQAGAMCSRANSGRHICASTGCVVGRPFLVRGEDRLAGLASRSDWVAHNVTADARELSAALRDRVADRWARVGLMEHASIAAFARFTLHLLALGAPPDLVLAAQQATVDETTHAGLAFALASAYGGAPIGPGALSIEGALDAFDIERFVATLLQEGCIGETLAAIEALEALGHARDPAVRQVLATIAADEQRHAELAWRTLAWLVAEGRVARSVVSAALIDVIERAAMAVGADAPDLDLRPYGILDDVGRRELRADALAHVIAPCARALLERVARACPTAAPVRTAPRGHREASAW